MKDPSERSVETVVQLRRVPDFGLRGPPVYNFVLYHILALLETWFRCRNAEIGS